MKRIAKDPMKLRLPEWILYKLFGENYKSAVETYRWLNFGVAYGGNVTRIARDVCKISTKEARKMINIDRNIYYFNNVNPRGCINV